jgi:hypothetical protein
MKRCGIVLFVLTMLAFFASNCQAKEYKGIATDGLNFSKEVRLDITGNICKVSIGAFTTTVTIEDPGSFMANPTGRVSAMMKFIYIPENDQYKVTFLISMGTNRTSGSSYAEGILSPQK